MLDSAFKIRLARFFAAEKVGDYFLPAERSKSQRCDEFTRATRHHYLYRKIFLLQAADEFRSFVGCDSSGDAQGDAHKSARSTWASEAFFRAYAHFIADCRAGLTRLPKRNRSHTDRDEPNGNKRGRLLAALVPVFVHVDGRRLHEIVLKHAVFQLFARDSCGLSGPRVFD